MRVCLGRGRCWGVQVIWHSHGQQAEPEGVEQALFHKEPEIQSAGEFMIRKADSVPGCKLDISEAVGERRWLSNNLSSIRHNHDHLLYHQGLIQDICHTTHSNSISVITSRFSKTSYFVITVSCSLSKEFPQIWNKVFSARSNSLYGQRCSLRRNMSCVLYTRADPITRKTPNCCQCKHWGTRKAEPVQ